jgi:hypothetical protein
MCEPVIVTTRRIASAESSAGNERGRAGKLFRWFSREAKVARAAGAPVLAVVPLTHNGAVLQPPDEAFVEAVRFARGALQVLPGGGPRKVAVCPAGPVGAAEDIAVYLAHSYAEAGKSVVCGVRGADMGREPAGQWMDRVRFVEAGRDLQSAATEYVVAMIGEDPDDMTSVAEADGVLLVYDAAGSLRNLRATARRLRAAGARIPGVIICERGRI